MCYTVEEIKSKAAPIAKAYGIQKMRSLIQYFSFIHELEKEFGCHVDVVTTGIEDKVFLSRIMKEGIMLYEA